MSKLKLVVTELKAEIKSLQQLDLQLEDLKEENSKIKIHYESVITKIQIRHEEERSSLLKAISRLEYLSRGEQPSHSPAPYLVVRAPLVDLPLFGEQRHINDDVDFRWPTTAHLSNML